MAELKFDKKIWVTANFTGFHKWPDAPEAVRFLAALHRHKFGVRLEVSVSHSDRDVEFFILQADLGKILGKELMPYLLKNPSLSCEMMAEFIAIRAAALKYTVLSVSVDEDGENGGTVTVQR